MKKGIHNITSNFPPINVLIGLILASAFFGCSTPRSVREIKASQAPQSSGSKNNLKVSDKMPYKYKAPKEALVKPLFSETKRANIELPKQEGMTTDPITGAAILAEKVTYSHSEVVSKGADGNTNTNLNEVQHLSEVVITARSRFTPERDGRVDVDFVIKVPKELMASDWRLTMQPQILHNDSAVPLKKVVLKGQGFADKQKQDYTDYEAYVKSIVKKSNYDDVFFDHDGMKKDLEMIQSSYYTRYYKDWSVQKDFDNWKDERSDFDAKNTAKELGYNQTKYHEMARRVQEQAMRDLAKGKDTTGLYKRYMKDFKNPNQKYEDALHEKRQKGYRQNFMPEYSKKARERVFMDLAKGKDTTGLYVRYMKEYDKISEQLILDGDDIKNVPKHLRPIYNKGGDLDKLVGQSMSAKDSVDIAQHRYKYDEIADNEIKNLRRDELKDEMIPFPMEENTRLDSIVGTDRDFTFYYTQDYPVTQGLKRLRLLMDTQIDAVDRSSFKMRQSDTLSYFISSLSQLIDTTMVFKKTKLHRDVYNRATAYIKFPAGKSTFTPGFKDNKAELNKMLDAYRTFTTEGKLRVDSIEMRVSTSLDGKYETNADLSMKRAKALKEYLSKNYSGQMDVENVIKVRYIGEDWNTLAQKIKQRKDLQNKDQILDMLMQATIPDVAKAEIQKAYPNDFRIIRDSIYPTLEKVDFVFNMTRPDMSEETTVKVEERDGYAEGLRLLQDREYWKAIQILSNYPDYNAALALLCMGYNDKAREVLERLDVNGNNEYLRAILSVRAGDENAAVQHLLKACELDPSKVYRAPLDTEMRDLIQKYNLRDQLVNFGNVVAPIEDETDK